MGDQPNTVGDEALIDALEMAWDRRDSTLANGMLPVEEVVPYSPLEESATRRRLTELADVGRIQTGLTVDLTDRHHRRGFAPADACPRPEVIA